MTPARGSLSIVIPLYQEAPGVADLARGIEPFLTRERSVRRVQLILVDDGSSDGTGDLLRQHFADFEDRVFLSHAHNLGLGAALETGGLSADCDYISWFDSDLTYEPGLLSKLAEQLDRGADVAIASCYHPEGGVAGVARWRLALSRAASSTYRRATGGSLHTYTSMVRAYRREVLERCPPSRGGFLAVTEVLLRALRAGCRIVEIPAVLHRRRTGHSKMRILRVAVGHLGLLGTLLLGRLDPPLVAEKRI